MTDILNIIRMNELMAHCSTKTDLEMRSKLPNISANWNHILFVWSLLKESSAESTPRCIRLVTISKFLSKDAKAVISHILGFSIFSKFWWWDRSMSVDFLGFSWFLSLLLNTVSIEGQILVTSVCGFVCVCVCVCACQLYLRAGWCRVV